MKQELYEKVVKVRSKSDLVMTIVLVFYEDVMRVICVYGDQPEDQTTTKINFIM